MTSCQSEIYNHTMKLCALKGHGLKARISYSSRIFVPKACFRHLSSQKAVEAIASEEKCNEIMESPTEMQAGFKIALTTSSTSTTTLATTTTTTSTTTITTTTTTTSTTPPTTTSTTSTMHPSTTTTSTTSSTSTTCSCPGTESSDECVALKIRCAWQNVLPSSTSNVSQYEYYSPFLPGREVISMKALIRCDDNETFGTEYDLVDPITSGHSGVLYHSSEAPEVLLKFPSMDVMDDMIGEVLLAEEFPDFVPRSTACVAKVTEFVGVNALGWPWREQFNSEETLAPVYPILLKEKIVGMPMDKVLMTLCDQNSGKRGPPTNCPLSESFSKEDYDAVKALQPREVYRFSQSAMPRRSAIGEDALQDLMQILTALTHHCSSTGIATRDLKAANFVYGSQATKKSLGVKIRRLFLVDAVYLHEQTLEATEDRTEQCNKMTKGIVAASWNIFCRDCPYWAGIPEDDVSQMFESRLPITHIQTQAIPNEFFETFRMPDPSSVPSV